jgi:hypothetical protein
MEGTLKTLEILKVMFQDNGLSEEGLRSAGLTIVKHEMAQIRARAAKGPSKLVQALEHVIEVALDRR